MVSKEKGKTIIKRNNAKVKRWKKGQSSSSNPDTKRFREAAKGRFFQHSSSSGSSGLTVDALKKHDDFQADKDGDVILSDSDKQSTKTGTFNTWASNWTECTNTTFNRVHRFWSSNSAVHREILAVLAAVTEVIKTQGGTESETEYFAALMTSLETSNSEESLAAIVYLISLVIKRVPTAVLRSRFSEVAKQFLDIMSTHESGSTSLLKSVLLCLANLLRVQEHAIWNNTSTQQVYKGLLTFITHRKPKVRKAAHQSLCIVLKGSVFMIQGDPPSHHPAASITAKYCIHIIEQSGGIGEASDTLHILSLLKDVLSVFPRNTMKSCCETVLKLMTLSNVMVTAGCMQALNGLFVAKPKASNLPAELNAQIITALYDYQPSENDVQPMQAWLTVMESAHVNLIRLDGKLAVSHLPRMISSAMTCLLSERTDVSEKGAKTIKALLQQCLAPAAEYLTKLVLSAPERGSITPVHKIIRAAESGLSYQFHASWGLVLQIFSTLYEVFGRQCPLLFTTSLKSIADLRDSVKFPYKAELDHAVGVAVKKMGPRHVLEALPLQITGEGDDLDFPRSWLLPVLHDNIMETELDFFISYFLPLAARLRQITVQYSREENIVAAKTYETLQLQIWSLLPGFCTRPTDLAKSFKGIAKVLGTAINERPDLRMDVMASLRKLVTQSLENDETKMELARFAKNFLPIFFNLYTTDPEKEKDPTRLAVLETTKCYLQIADKELIATFCDNCLKKLNEGSLTPFKRYALYDVAIALLPGLASDKITALYEVAAANLKSDDRKLQKKSYRILEEICAGKSQECRDFVKSHLKTLQKLMSSSLAASSPSSKAPRLRCLINIFKHLENREQKFLVAVIPEAILCTKEVAERARASAYTLLVEMGNTVMRWSRDKTPEESLEEYFKLVMAGFAGSPQMISATLLALTRVLYQFKEKISSSLLTSIVDSVCLLLNAKPREVVKSALAFLKVLLSAYPETVLSSHLQQLVASIVSMKEDCRHHFRFKAKEIYAKLIRKFGYETIYGMVPEGLRKVLANIKKTQERSKRKKKETENDESIDEDETEKKLKTQPECIDDLLRDTDSDMEEAQERKSVQKDKRKMIKETKGGEKPGMAWLQEGGIEDIVDFMDTSAAKKVLATKPVKSKVKQKSAEPEFKIAPDGRLIITEVSDEEEGGQISSDEELNDLLATLEGARDSGKIRQKKRKLEDMGSDEEDMKPLKYKAGGKGIHRPLEVSQDKKNSDYGAEYRAKKARGDVKKKGRPDPYAYVPLNRQQLNKRKRAKLEGQFGNLVRGAQKGASKGKKAKKKHK
ncbi:hypothetical protein CHS0354_015294 [Potamilus streckersoni]|uniref:RRP12-like protein n=1 Tax=Potamilus streckersoni TaxID=2493646 RepID=A0AAE0VMY4_9BIVA|nr:hypothetical protein CHS0354_015294 [Potamilus streckersoni]